MLLLVKKSVCWSGRSVIGAWTVRCSVIQFIPQLKLFFN